MTTQRDLLVCPNCQKVPVLKAISYYVTRMSMKPINGFWFECPICGKRPQMGKNVLEAQNNWNDKIRALS